MDSQIDRHIDRIIKRMGGREGKRVREIEKRERNGERKKKYR